MRPTAHRLILATVALIGCVLWFTPSLGAQGVPDSLRIARLATVARIWNAARFMHPWLAYRDVDWDAAMIRALPLVEAAGDTDSYATAVQSLLSELGDPATRVIHARSATNKSAAAVAYPTSRWTEDRVLVVTIGDYKALEDFGTAVGRLAAIAPLVDSARAVVFDLREVVPGASGYLDGVFTQSGIAERLVGERLAGLGRRQRLQTGYEPGDPIRWQTSDGRVFEPGPGVSWRPVAFITNDRSELPDVALALVVTDRASLVVDGTLGGVDASTERFHLEGSEDVELRLTEPLYLGQTLTLAPDTIAVGSEAMAAALAFVRSGAVRSHALRFAPQAASEVFDVPNNNPATPYPSPPFRLLAAFRVWGVFEYFHPYQRLITSDWANVLTDLIPTFESAGDSLEYALAVSAMVARTDDSHDVAVSPTLRAWRGGAPIPVQWQWVEGKVVVTRLTDAAAERAGFRVGDVVRAIDGDPLSSRMERLAPFFAGSTPQGKIVTLLGLIGRGPQGSEARITVERENGIVLDLTVRHDARYGPGVVDFRDGPILRMLPDNVGYADLDRLPLAMVDSLFSMFKHTRAIVFDMRGYPEGFPAPVIAQHLTDRDRVTTSIFRVPVVTPAATAVNMYPVGALAFEYPTFSGPPLFPTYRGRTVMLIDERARSAAEATGMGFEAANGTAFIGTPTAGANGWVGEFVVPGDVTVRFSAADIRYADGRQLQRVGLQPRVLVSPTIEGIRAGRDEVLEKALEYLREPN